MNFDFTFQPPSIREKPYSVSEINYGISEILQKENLFVCVEGEVSGYKKAYSGHSYFTLKDEESKIPAVIWKDKKEIPKIEDGMKIVVFAEIKVYQTGGYYQLDVFSAFESGTGKNFAELEILKQKLLAEGLFSPEKKRILPSNIKKIGVITAKNGAAFYDILKIMEEFAPNIDIMLSPAVVQGKTAATSLIKAIKNINKLDNCDVIIFGRGGGSKEDLSAFNEEEVVRSVANSKIPIICAVGHEINKSLCDFAADIYAPTPTAAAQMVCRAGFEIRNSFEELSLHFQKIVRKKLFAINNFEQLLDDFSIDLCNSFKRNYEQKYEKIQNYERILSALNPNLPLKKGFALIKNEDGKIVKSAKNLSFGQKIKIIFDKNQVGAKIDEL
ncbi:MAG: exodeoxyribonuclease VII large subunit [Chitinivibrionia bacterium]|nr:exodeoxyribonuclease VII large subunit [Chitinivibrionia bacterium]